MTAHVGIPELGLDGVSLDPPLFDPAAFRLSDEETALAAKARAMGQAIFAQRAAIHDRDASFPTENYRDLHKAGLLAICIPKGQGGLGADYRAYSICAAEIGRYCGATALTWNMHVCSTLWSGPLADDLDMDAATRAAHERRRALHYRRIVADGAIYAQPFSEGGAAAAGGAAFGTRPARSRAAGSSTARRSSPRCPAHADYYGVLAHRAFAATAAPSRRNTLYLAVPATGRGRLGRRRLGPARHARHGVAHARCSRTCSSPRTQALMPRGLYFQAATRWPHMFLTLSPTYIGLAQAAYDFTVAYLRGEAPGTPPVKRRMYPTKQIAVARDAHQARADEGALVPGRHRGAGRTRARSRCCAPTRRSTPSWRAPTTSRAWRSAPAAGSPC